MFRINRHPQTSVGQQLPPPMPLSRGIIPQDRKVVTMTSRGPRFRSMRSWVVGWTSHIQTKTSLDHRQQTSRRAARRDGEASGWSPTVSGPLAGGGGLSYRYVTCNQEAWCLILSELVIILVSGSLNSRFNCGCLGTFRDCVKIVSWEREVRKKY